MNKNRIAKLLIYGFGFFFLYIIASFLLTWFYINMSSLGFGALGVIIYWVISVAVMLPVSFLISYLYVRTNHNPISSKTAKKLILGGIVVIIFFIFLFRH